MQFSTIRRLAPALSLLAVLVAIFIAGCVAEPERFPAFANQRDVWRQVAIQGIVAIGMTFVIITAGIDLSVGRLVGLGSTVTAMLLMERAWTAGSYLAVPCMGLGGAVVGGLLWFLLPQATRGTRLLLSVIGGGAAAVSLMAWGAGQVATGFGVAGVLVGVPMVCLLAGLVSGVLVAKCRLQPFIATLAMWSSAYGAGRLIAGGGGRVHSIYTGTEPGQATPGFELLGANLPLFGREDVLPVPALIFIAVSLLGYWALSQHRFGRSVYAVGGNEEAARLAGVPVDRIKLAVYAISGVLCGLGAVLYGARYAHGKPDAGFGWELDAIAAVVIGGTSLMGGRGSILGTFIGVLIFGYITNITQLLQWPTDWQLVVKGVVIVLAVLIHEGQIVRWMRQAIGVATPH